MRKLVSIAGVTVLLVLTTLLGAAPASAADYNVPFSGSASQAVVSGDQIFDHGGAGNYSDGANGTLTLTAGGSITLIFTVFETESCCDFVTIFDGPTTGDPILFGPTAGTPALPIVVTSTGTSMTVRFTTDSSVVEQGFQATVTGPTGAPTMGAWALIIVSLMLVSLGMVMLRRRKQTA